MERATYIFCIIVVVLGSVVLSWTPQGRDRIFSTIIGTAIGCLIGWAFTKDD